MINMYNHVYNKSPKCFTYSLFQNKIEHHHCDYQYAKDIQLFCIIRRYYAKQKMMFVGFFS